MSTERHNLYFATTNKPKTKANAFLFVPKIQANTSLFVQQRQRKIVSTFFVLSMIS